MTTTVLTPLTVATTATTGAAVAAGKHTPVDATTAAVTMTLPTPATVGARLRVEKIDASANAVTVTGKIRGATASITLTSQNHVMEFQAESLTSWRPVGDHRTKASLDAAYAPPTAPGTGGLVAVAGNAVTAQGTASYGADALRSWNTKHPFTASCSFIVLEFANWYPNAGSDADGPAAMTLRVGYDPNGPSNGTGILPVKWAGADTISVPPGGTVRSDPIYVDGIAGQNFWLRTTCTMASGTTYVYNTFADTGYAFSPVQDNSRSGTNWAGGNNQAVGPVRILGVPTTPPRRVVALVGDSILTGANAALSWIGGFEAALTAQNVPFVKISKGGESVTNVTGLAPFSRRLALVAGCTDAIVEYGTNDLLAGRTAAQVQADLITIYQRLQRLGVKRIYQSTITPRSTSTDNFITTANQTPQTGFGPSSAQATLNTWIRAGGSGYLTAYIEVEALMTPTVGSGIWNGPLRSVTDAAATSGSATVTSATANFTAADVGARVVIAGAGTSGAAFAGSIKTVTNATTVTLASSVSTTVSGAALYIGLFTSDGTHPSETGHQLIKAAIPDFTAAV